MRIPVPAPLILAPVAQCTERIPPEDEDAGEIPAGSTIPNTEWGDRTRDETLTAFFILHSAF